MKLKKLYMKQEFLMKLGKNYLNIDLVKNILSRQEKIWQQQNKNLQKKGFVLQEENVIFTMLTDLPN